MDGIRLIDKSDYVKVKATLDITPLDEKLKQNPLLQDEFIYVPQKINLTNSENLIILWRLVKQIIQSTPKIIEIMYYSFLFINEGGKMWETLKTNLFVHWRTTLIGVAGGIYVYLQNWVNSGVTDFNWLNFAVSILIAFVGIVLPDAKWLVNLLAKLLPFTKKKDTGGK